MFFNAHMILGILNVSHVFNLHLSAILCTVICSQGCFHQLFSITFGFSSRKHFFFPQRYIKKKSRIANFI